MRFIIFSCVLLSTISVTHGIECFQGKGRADSGVPPKSECPGTSFCVSKRGVGDMYGIYDCGNSANHSAYLDVFFGTKVCTTAKTETLKDFTASCCSESLCNYPTTTTPKPTTAAPTTQASLSSDNATYDATTKAIKSDAGMLSLNVNHVIALLGAVLVF